MSLNLVSSKICVGNSIKDMPGLIHAPYLGLIIKKRKNVYTHCANSLFITKHAKKATIFDMHGRYQNMANDFFLNGK